MPATNLKIFAPMSKEITDPTINKGEMTRLGSVKLSIEVFFKFNTESRDLSI